MNREELFFDPIENSQELAVIDLEGEDGIVREYAVLAIFSAPPFAYEYMAVMNLDDFDKEEDEQEIVFMRYEEEDDGFILDGIENEIELDCVSEHYFDRMMD